MNPLAEAAYGAAYPCSLRRPPALREGDRIGVLSVSGPAIQQQLAVGLDALRFAGLVSVVYDSARDPGSARHYLAGDDGLRVADLRSALVDQDIAGILPT